jgi:hypothetical protein
MRQFMKSRRLLYPAILITVITVGLWIATDRHSYTKFEVVETVQAPVQEDDPLAGTGFYDEGTQEKTVHRAEFHLGLLPTPRGLFDKHALSVMTILTATWGFYLGLLLLSRRRSPLAQVRNIPMNGGNS